MCYLGDPPTAIDKLDINAKCQRLFYCTKPMTVAYIKKQITAESDKRYQVMMTQPAADDVPTSMPTKNKQRPKPA